MPFVIGQAFSPEVLSLVRQKQEAEKQRELEQQRINLSAWESQQRNRLAVDQMRLERDRLGLSADDFDLRRQALQQQIESERMGQLRADEQLNLQRGAQGLDAERLNLAAGAQSYDQDLAARRMNLAEDQYQSGLDLSKRQFEESLNLNRSRDRRDQETHDFTIKTENPARIQYLQSQAQRNQATAESAGALADARKTSAEVDLMREKRLSAQMSVSDATRLLNARINAARVAASTGDYATAREAVESIQEELQQLRRSGSMLPEQIMRTRDGATVVGAAVSLGQQVGGEPTEGDGGFDDLLARMGKRAGVSVSPSRPASAATTSPPNSLSPSRPASAATTSPPNSLSLRSSNNGQDIRPAPDGPRDLSRERLESGMQTSDAVMLLQSRVQAARSFSEAGDSEAARKIIEDLQDEMLSLRQSGSMLPEKILRSGEGAQIMSEILALSSEIDDEEADKSDLRDRSLPDLGSHFSFPFRPMRVPSKDANPPTGR